MLTHIAGEVTTLATCWKITRTDGTVMRYTDHDVDLIVSGDTYLAMQGFNPTAVQNDSSFSVDNVEIAAVFNEDAITAEDIRAGKYDYADVRLFVVNWADTTMGIIKIRRGWLGECMLTPEGYFKTELRGLTQAIQQNIGEFYSVACRADLGDARCKIPLNPPIRADSTAYKLGDFIRVATSPLFNGYHKFRNHIFKCTVAGTTASSEPTYDTTLGNTTVDGTASFICMTAWTRYFEIATVTDQANFTLTTELPEPDGWFAQGVITFESGDNAGASFEIKGWTQSSAAVTLYLATGYPVQVGDYGFFSPGCDKLEATCHDKFSNVINMRAEPYVPGTDSFLLYPNADGSVPG
jgi:uncharacterized phage protein (TIGR02218 family)